MARILGPEAFNTIDFDIRVYMHQRYDLYRVYTSRDDFVEVEAGTAAEALRLSGIANPRRIKHCLPPFRTVALLQQDIRRVEGDEEDVYFTLPPEQQMAPEDPLAHTFVPLEYAAYGREQHGARLLHRVEEIEDSALAGMEHKSKLSEDDVNVLLQPRDDA